CVAVSSRLPSSFCTRPGRSATNLTSAPGTRLSISYGPTTSSAVNRSNNTIANCIVILPLSNAAGARAKLQQPPQQPRKYKNDDRNDRFHHRPGPDGLPNR